MSQEVLQAGPAQQPREVRPAVLWAVGLVALALFCLASIVGIAELATRSVEVDRLLTAVEASEAAMVTTQERVSRAFEELPAQPSQSDVAALRGELSQIAADGEASIAAAGEQVAGLTVLPWHFAIRDAREAYLAHNAAWVDYLGAASANPEEFLQPQPEVNDTFREARLPLLAAVPLLDLRGGVERIAVIYDDGEQDDEPGAGGGQAT